MNKFDKKQLIKRYLDNNKKLQNNYKKINELKQNIDYIIQKVPAKILSKEEIKDKKDKKDKKKDKKEEDKKEEDKDEDKDLTLTLEEIEILESDGFSPDSPIPYEENMVDKYTNVEELFNKRKTKFDEDEIEDCKDSIVWKNLIKIKDAKKYYEKLKEITTNPKYYIFNQVYFHAGDEVQFERYAFIKSRYLSYTSNYKKDNSIFDGYNLDTTYKTFEYIFNKLKKGIYISFKNNKLDTFIPFSNINYINDWSRILESSNKDLVKKIIDTERYGQKINISDPSKWYANNCIFKTDGMKFKFRKYISEGDKTVIPMKYFLKGFEKYLKDTKQKIDDMDFFFNPRDFPILKQDYLEPYEQIYPDKHIEDKYHYKTYTPILSQSGNENYHDLLCPTEDDMLRITKNIYPDECENKYMKDINFELDFSKKKSICVFRGSATGCGITTDTNMRLKAAQLSYDLNEKGINILDAKLTSWNQKPKMYNGQLNEINKSNFKFKVGTENYMNLEEQSKHKYILNIDGHVKAFRLGNEFRMGSVILLVKSPYTLWFQQYLKDKVHYIEINEDLSNLEEEINWCIKHEDKCTEIAKNGIDFYNTYLTPEKTYEYFFNLTNKLSKIRKPPTYKMNNNKLNIILAYRNSDDDSRREQLEIYKSQIDIIFKNKTKYHIYIIEQESDRDDYDTLSDEFKQEGTRMAKFNLGRLKNIGFELAEKDNRGTENAYYVLSDIDMLPSYNLVEDYLKFPKNPIHLANLGTRYSETGSDADFLGGVVSFNDKDFIESNGYPNNFWGWGGEDNVLSDRLKTNKIEIEKSKYPVIDLENISLDDKRHLLWEKKLKMDKKLKIERRKKDKETWKENGLFNLEGLYKILDINKDEDNDNVSHIKVFLNTTKQKVETEPKKLTELGKEWVESASEDMKERVKKEEPKEKVEGFSVNMKVSWTNKKGDIFTGTIKELKEKFAIITTDKDRDAKIPYKKLTKIKEEEKSKKEKGKPKKEIKEEEPKAFIENARVSWSDKKGSYEGIITKANPKTANILADNGDNKRVPYAKLTLI